MRYLTRWRKISRCKSVNETELIRQIISQLGEQTQSKSVLLGPGDDAAVVRWNTADNVVLTTDTFIAGRHFPEDTPGDLVGYRCIAATLSDVVAMSARPLYITVALTVETNSQDWVFEFVKGVRTCCAETNTCIIGGNMACGSKSVTVSAIGSVPNSTYVRRDTVCISDEIWLTGKLGATDLAISAYVGWQPKTVEELLQQRDNCFMAAYFLPRVRIEFVEKVRTFVSTLTDVSDGLQTELEHMVQFSNLGARIDVEQVNMWDRCHKARALGCDDSYELLFTLPKGKRTELATCAVTTSTECRCIGEITSTKGVKFFDNGQEIFPVSGYSHF